MVVFWEITVRLVTLHLSFFCSGCCPYTGLLRRRVFSTNPEVEEIEGAEISFKSSILEQFPEHLIVKLVSLLHSHANVQCQNILRYSNSVVAALI